MVNKADITARIHSSVDAPRSFATLPAVLSSGALSSGSKDALGAEYSSFVPPVDTKGYDSRYCLPPGVKAPLSNDSRNGVSGKNSTHCFDPTDASLYLKNGIYYSSDKKVLLKCVSKELHIVVLDGCEEIAERAFAHCAHLKSIALPSSIKVIDDFALMDTSLDSFDAPQSLTTIGSRAFLSCSHLTQVTLNEGLCEIGSRAFEGCPVTHLIIPRTVNLIGDNAFPQKLGPVSSEGSEVSRFEARTLSESLSSKKESAKGSYELSRDYCTISFESGNRVYELADNGALYMTLDSGEVILQKVLYAFGVTFEVKEGTAAIGEYAFSRITTLQEILLPEGLREIRDNAFRGCSNLHLVRFPESLQRIGHRAFLHTKLESVYLPAGFTELFEDSLENVPAGKFRNAPRLKYARIHQDCNRYKIIGDFLCDLLDERGPKAIACVVDSPIVRIPYEVKSVGYLLLNSYGGIEELHVHDDLASFEPSAFAVFFPVRHVYVHQIKAATSLQMKTGEVPIEHFKFGGIPACRQMFVQAFSKGEIIREQLAYYSDKSWILERNAFLQFKHVLKRLSNPHLMHPGLIDTLGGMIRFNLTSVVEEFAKQSYFEGMERLVALGFIDAENIATVVETASNIGNHEFTAQVLQLQHVSFDDREATLSNSAYSI